MGAAFFFVIIVVNAKPTTQTGGEWRPTSGEKKSRVAREALLAKHVFFVWFSDFSVTMLEILGCQGGMSILGGTFASLNKSMCSQFISELCLICS